MKKKIKLIRRETNIINFVIKLALFMYAEIVWYYGSD
jgi:hypothetical protein